MFGAEIKWHIFTMRSSYYQYGMQDNSYLGDLIIIYRSTANTHPHTQQEEISNHPLSTPH